MKTKIKFARIIVYIALTVLAFTMYDFLHSHFLLIMIVLLTALPPISLIMCFVLYRFIDIEVSAPGSYVYKNEMSYVKLVTVNPTWTVSMNVTVGLETENTFYSQKALTEFFLPARLHGRYELMIPMKLTRNGHIAYHVDYIRVRDLMGFVDIYKKLDKTSEINVLPSGNTGERLTAHDVSKGTTESEETAKKGHDFSDVSDVREYIPGDKLMSIHWKLSAKRDILMVKDRESMSDEQIVVLVSLSGSPAETDDVIDLSYTLLEGLVRDGMYVRLLWWSDAAFEIREKRILSIEDMKEAFSLMYYEKIYQDKEKVRGYIRSIMPHLTAIIDIGINEQGEADAEVVELG